MNILNIIVAEPGKGRPVNPFDKATCSDIAKQIDCLGNNECICFKHSLFEDDVQPLPAYKSDRVTLLPVGEYKVREVWQFKSYYGNWVDNNMGIPDYDSFVHYWSQGSVITDTRRIYREVDTPEPIDSGEVKESTDTPSCFNNLELLALAWKDHKEWVGTNHERHFNRGFMAGLKAQSSQTATLQEEAKELKLENDSLYIKITELEGLQEDNKRLREALKQIDQMSDCGSYATAVISMKNIANKALNNK